MYKKNVERAFPGCVIFLLDQSGSMNEGMAGGQESKMARVAVAVNRFIQQLIANCEKGEELPRYYFDVGVIGYTNDESGSRIGPVLGGALAGRDLVSVVDLSTNPLDTETRHADDGMGGIRQVRFLVWYRVPAQPGGTPMVGRPLRCIHTRSPTNGHLAIPTVFRPSSST